jgi:hypothetical protein
MTMSTRFRVLIGVSVVALTSSTALTMADAASGASPGQDIGYAVNRPLCATAVRPGQVNCFALRRVEVKKGTPGARPYLKTFTANSVPGAKGRVIGPGPAGGFTPDDIAAAYQYNPTVARSGQTVGIVDWFNDPHVKSDLGAFEAEYSLPSETASSFRVVNQNGAKSPLPSSAQGRDSAGEIALDVETVRAVCNTCRILLVEAAGPTDADLAAAENTAVRLGATEVSNSFGAPEVGATASFRSAFDQPGVVITASTGDDGWYGWDFANNNSSSESSPEFPATASSVVAVGGTTLELNNDGSIADEFAWNENGEDDQAALTAGEALGAGGGGCSQRFAAPAWQSAFPGYSAAGCSGKRLAADVSAIADPETGFDIFDTWGSGDHGWLTVGGTSLSSPLVAAMFALAGGSGQAKYPARSIYTNASATPTLVNDITAGGNGFCGGDTTANCGTFVFNNFTGGHTSPNALNAGLLDCSFPHNGTDPVSAPPLSSECNATTGYDGPTGLGTPIGTGLFASTSPTASLTRPKIVRLHKSATFVAHSTERMTGAHITGATFTWGDGHSSTTGPALSAAHSFAKKGRYVVVVTVKDSAGQQSVAHTTVTVGKSLSLSLFGPSTAKHGHRARFRAQAADPNTGGKITRISWSWGDHGKSKGAGVSHTWRKAGKYTITITLADNTGVRTTYTAKIRIK